MSNFRKGSARDITPAKLNISTDAGAPFPTRYRPHLYGVTTSFRQWDCVFRRHDCDTGSTLVIGVRSLEKPPEWNRPESIIHKEEDFPVFFRDNFVWDDGTAAGSEQRWRPAIDWTQRVLLGALWTNAGDGLPPFGRPPAPERQQESGSPVEAAQIGKVSWWRLLDEILAHFDVDAIRPTLLDGEASRVASLIGAEQVLRSLVISNTREVCPRKLLVGGFWAEITSALLITDKDVVQKHEHEDIENNHNCA